MMNARHFPPKSTLRRYARLVYTSVLTAMLVACGAIPHPPSGVANNAYLTPATPATHDLAQLPPPLRKTVVAVYGFRDETGQYKPAPDSSFSTAVTQGAASILIKALKDSGWFIPVEREGLQSLLTERRVLRAVDAPAEKGGAPKAKVPDLLPAAILLDGGIVSYDSNVRTGGLGAEFLGIGMTTQYRVDQVGVNLRSIDVNTGEILQSVSTTKTIYSYEIHPSVFKFVNTTDLLQIEGGVTSNEPAELCVKEAIESAVMHLTIEGLKDHDWQLRNQKSWDSPVIQKYLHEEQTYMMPVAQSASATAVGSTPSSFDTAVSH